MSRVLTNNFGLQFAVEESIGVLPTTPTWRVLEPNDVGEFGAQIETVERRPISKVRGRRKGVVVDLNSTVDFEGDLTMESFDNFAEGFIFSEFANVEFELTTEKIKGSALDVTATGYALGAALSTLTNGTLLAGKMIYTVSAGITLVLARGYAIPGNNGYKELDADVTPASTEVTTAGLAVETAPAEATLSVAGVRVSDGDLTLTVTGSTATLVSAADIADWSVLGLLPGQEIHIGGVNDSDGTLINALQDSVPDDTFGYARVTSISGSTLNLDKLDEALAAVASADNTGTGVADVLFGRFLRNVDVDQDSDDSRFLERTYQIEGSYPNLGAGGATEYEYAIGNTTNEVALAIPLTEKSTVNWGFIGTNTDDITLTRKTNAANALTPLRIAGVGTSSDIVSLTTDVVALASDVCFNDLTVTFGNNVSPEKCIGTLGAAFINSGLFEVNLEGQMLFTSKEITNAIKNNTTVTFQTILRNVDGGLCIDIPSLTFGNGQKEYPVDQSVLINITGLAFNDPTGIIPNVSVGISTFAIVPYA